MPTTLEVANTLVDLCRQGKFNEAMEATYSPDIVSIEPMSNSPDMPARIEGIAAVRAKAQWWEQNHTVTNVQVAGPWPHGDRFIVRFTLDVTAKTGKMAGQKLSMDEAALYTVRNGKIVYEEFFYHM